MAETSLPDSAEAPAPTMSLNKPAPQLKAPQRAAIDAIFQNDAGVRLAITENLKTLRAESEAVAKRVQQAFENYNPSKLSTEELARRHYVPPGADPAEMIEAVIIKGVDAIRSSNIEPTITLHNSGDLKRLITDAPEGAGSLLGTIDLETLVNFITLKQNAYPSVAADPAYTLYKAEVKAQEILDIVEKAPESTRSSSEASTADSSPRNRKADQLVEDAVNHQMNSAKAPEEQLVYSIIANSAGNDEVQKGILQTFQLRPSPSDEISYHDFNTLQIAFAHVWTQIFDGQLASLGRDLYQEYVKLKDFAGSTDPDLTISTLDDLKRLMAEIRKLSQTVQDDTPSDLRGEGGDSKHNNPKGSGYLGDEAKGALGVATGGLSLLVEWALEEISKAGKKPLLTWEDFPGPLPGHLDTIEVSFENDAVPEGTVEIVLKTDDGSHYKEIEFEIWDPATARFYHGPKISNGGNNYRVTLSLMTSQIASGALEFSSEEGAIPVGRYLLGDLTKMLKDRRRVTFHWKGVK